MLYRLIVLFGSFIIIVGVLGCAQAPVPAAWSGDALAGTATPVIVDTSHAATPTAGPADGPPLPPSVQILSPKYQEAYRLLPDGPWAKRYYWNYFTEGFNPEAYAALEYVEPVTPVRVAPTKLDRAEEWLLTRVINDSSMSDWLDAKIRELGEEAVTTFEMAETPLDGLRKLVALGWGDDVVLIGKEWEARKAGASGDVLARVLEAQRVARGNMDLIQLPPKQLTQRIWEQKVCVSLLSAALDGAKFPWRVLSDGACDINETLRLAREALDARNGQARLTEDDYRELVEAWEAR